MSDSPVTHSHLARPSVSNVSYRIRDLTICALCGKQIIYRQGSFAPFWEHTWESTSSTTLTAEEQLPKTPGMVRLIKIKEPNTYNDEVVAENSFEEFAVRADLIEWVGVARYPIAWRFEEAPEGWYETMFTHRWVYWNAYKWGHGLRVKIQGFENSFVIEGNFDHVLAQIDRESRHG